MTNHWIIVPSCSSSVTEGRFGFGFTGGGSGIKIAVIINTHSKVCSTHSKVWWFLWSQHWALWPSCQPSWGLWTGSKGLWHWRRAHSHWFGSVHWICTHAQGPGRCLIYTIENENNDTYWNLILELPGIMLHIVKKSITFYSLTLEHCSCQEMDLLAD